jgi:hypothetical protein
MLQRQEIWNHKHEIVFDLSGTPSANTSEQDKKNEAIRKSFESHIEEMYSKPQESDSQLKVDQVRDVHTMG